MCWFISWPWAAAYLFFCLLVSIHWYLSRDRSKQISRLGRVLLVIAHPDDETMFFSPSIIGITRQNCDVYLLCLSSGDFRTGQGQRRKGELLDAVQYLGLKSEAVTVIEHSRLPDDPSAVWNKQLIGNIVLRFVDTLDIDTVLTFDSGGVSRHANHRSVFSSVQQLYSRGRLRSGTQVLVLETVSLLRKYCGLADVWPSQISATFVYVGSWADVWQSFRAMSAHWSQLTWFRVLYLIFSRYMVTIGRQNAQFCCSVQYNYHCFDSTLSLVCCARIVESDIS